MTNIDDLENEVYILSKRIQQVESLQARIIVILYKRGIKLSEGLE